MDKVKTRKAYTAVGKVVGDEDDLEMPEPPPPQQSTGPSETAKLLSFFALVIIQGGHVLFFKLSQHAGGHYTYNTASAIAVTEAFKFAVSLLLFLRSAERHKPEAASVTVNQLACYVLLALAYCVNNQLTFWLLRDLGPGQLSLGKSMVPMLTAALLWAVYDERINSLQWGCVVLTVAGIINIIQPDNSATNMHQSTSLLVVSCFITALASVVNARLLQKSSTSIHVQNMILYSTGFVMNVLAYTGHFTPSESNLTFFQGYDNPFVLGVLVSQSLMGIAITFVYKYGGAIVKTLASAVQGALLFLIDVAAFGVSANLTSLSGVVVTLTASYVYFSHALSLPPQPPTLNQCQARSVRGVLGIFFAFCFIFSGVSLMAGGGGLSSSQNHSVGAQSVSETLTPIPSMNASPSPLVVASVGFSALGQSRGVTDSEPTTLSSTATPQIASSSPTETTSRTATQSASLTPTQSISLTPTQSISLTPTQSISLTATQSLSPSPSPSVSLPIQATRKLPEIPNPPLTSFPGVELISPLPLNLPSAPTKNKRVAILLAGLPRTFERTWPEMKKRLIDPNPEILFDLFLHTSLTSPFPTNEALHNRFIEVYQDLGRGVRVMSITIAPGWSPSSPFPESLWQRGCQSGNEFMGLRHTYANHARLLAEKAEGIKYDRVMHLRFDAHLNQEMYLERDWWAPRTFYFILGDFTRWFRFLDRDWDFGHFGEPDTMDLWQSRWKYRRCALDIDVYALTAHMPDEFPKHCVAPNECYPLLPPGFHGRQLYETPRADAMDMDAQFILRAWYLGFTLDVRTSNDHQTYLHLVR